MSETSFEQYYAEFTDDQLAQVMNDKRDLVPEALSALDREVQRRNLKQPERLGRAHEAAIEESGPEDDLHSLEEDWGYQKLAKRKRFMDRFWYLLAFAPVVLMMVSAKYAYRVPENIQSSVAWVILIAGYWLFLKGRFAAYSCPNCAQRFGAGEACFYCGFPRSSAARNASRQDKSSRPHVD